eukprot:2591753-Pleurochrysis_carterae.AAC.4
MHGDEAGEEEAAHSATGAGLNATAPFADSHLPFKGAATRDEMQVSETSARCAVACDARTQAADATLSFGRA